ncbi:PfkB family carbohydrate kinase [Arthrobacter silvisoli]|uniref:PfkB family carbohydrate kinase n=1 Tax=Arthrobacter silvisoli TaxID=2291022 RepID=UPI000E21A81A|nr:PfkB family carbohydrate kinase [Arthrobacter silvisoli]
MEAPAGHQDREHNSRERFDPLAAVRATSPGAPGAVDDGGCDLLLSGTVFQDIIFTGLGQRPEPGTEVWSQGMGSCPGGIANQAIAAARLGLHTSLAAAFGDDGYGELNWKILENQEEVDLSLSRRFQGWPSPVTVSLCVEQDRSMVTHGLPAPLSGSELIGTPPPALAAVAELGEEAEPWVLAAHRAGVKIFGDAGWDPSGAWSRRRLEQLGYFHAFMPNQREAMAFTGADNPWSALYILAERVPVAVVTLGAQGAMAVDSETGEEEWVPALPVTAHDPTGAGDCFGAAFIVGCLAGWPLGDRLRFANLCASLSVQELGGSFSAPGWGDISDWWHRANARPERQSSQWLRRFAFLEDIVSRVPEGALRRSALRPPSSVLPAQH